MKYAIPSDIATVDSDGDGAIDRLYVGDTRGQVFRIDLGDQIDPSGATTALKNGGSSGYVFADIGCTGGVRSDNCALTAKTDRRKFFYAPAIVQARDMLFSATADYDLIVLSSGDREDPLDKITKDLSIDPVNNRIYAFRDYNFRSGAPASTTTLDDSDLYDSTSNALQDPNGSDYSTALADIKNSHGWRVDLKESSSPNWIGEKGLSHPSVFKGVLYVTSYVPPSSDVVTGPGICPPPAEGIARLYGLNYLSGAGMVDLTGDGSIDRFTEIGGGIPSEIVVVSREGGTTALVGTSGGASQGVAGQSPACLPPGCFKMEGGLPQYPTFWHDN
jgi:type IV pilus assembly protein PilY1